MGLNKDNDSPIQQKWKGIYFNNDEKGLQQRLNLHPSDINQKPKDTVDEIPLKNELCII